MTTSRPAPNTLRGTALPQASPVNIKAARMQAQLTQQKAAELVHRNDSARWREWESGRHQMDTAVWELFLVKAGIRGVSPLPQISKD